EPGDIAEMTFLFGQADGEEKARGLVTRFRDPANVEAAFQETRHWWDRLLSTIEVETPELSTNFLLNRWLLYQTRSCRVWGRTAGDAAILDQMIPFLEGKPLEEQQTESLSIPVASATEASLLEHCRRAIRRAATSGPHGLPLIGGGDWNDGLNRVGLGGKGES